MKRDFAMRSIAHDLGEETKETKTKKKNKSFRVLKKFGKIKRLIFNRDLEKGACTVRDAHSEIINALDGCGGLKGAGAPEIATGSRDGT